MFHLQDEYVKKHLFDGMYGLEKESLRVTSDGSFSHTPHPAPGDSHIVRDFCENQIEINTDPYNSAEEALSALIETENGLREKLASLDEPEFLWAFSNPPYIRNEDDIPIAIYTGDEAWKTEYRKHLSGVYGRYKMTFSGIHVNYSFSDDLLRREAELSGDADYKHFKNDFYIALTEKLSYCGWLVVALTAASPVVDGSFTGGCFDDTVNTGMSSLRCSESGYWNFFDPVFDYSSLDKYVDSIEKYVDNGMLNASSELYYPVRLKPNSMYSIDNLRNHGAGHIELRMYDLNPLIPEGVDIRDIEFAGYLIIYLAMGGRIRMSYEDQINAVRNFKNAAHFDIDSTMIFGKGGFTESIREAATGILECMKEFFASMLGEDHHAVDVIDYQLSKMTDDENRYAVRVLKEYGSDFVRKGLKLIMK